MAARPESDYGDELDWDDSELETQLTAIESAPLASTSKARSSEPARVEVDGGLDEATEPLQDAGGISMDLEAALDVLEDGPTAPRSLWERYRKRRGWGGLSVSDLVGPSWCEVQHSYRLSSKSHLPPEERPSTIVTSAGASIPLNAARTVAREVVLDKGREVHRVLEKEAMGDAEQVKVAIGQKEEWWALRILNTAVCLETLIASGLAREIPVVGFVGDFLVFGVIDEIDRRELPPPPPPAVTTSSKKGKGTPSKEEDTRQRKLDQFFPPSPSKKGKEKAVDQDEEPPPEPKGLQWGFVISDSKTRYNRSLPSKNESRASRLQLMLYHRLLSSLLTPPSDSLIPEHGPEPFDWPRLYEHLSLDPTSPFTEPFLASIQPVIIGSSLDHSFGNGKTLADFVATLQRYGETLGARDGRGPFQDQLEINYRLRNTVRKWKPRKKSRKEREQEDLERAIAESMQAEARSDNVATAGEDEEDLARAFAMSLEETQLEPEVIKEVEKVLTVEDDAPTASLVDAEMEQLAADVPFVADVSLLLPSSPSRPSSKMEQPSPSAILEDLPSNSQETPAAPLRYNVRRRRATTTTANENLDPHTGVTSASNSPSKRLRSASPPPVPAATEAAPRSPTPPPSPPEQIPEGSLIGTERFKNSPEELEQWLSDVTSLWKGEREPRGVSLDQTSRCRTCEFEEGCEWRQTKAQEELEKTRARNRALAEGRNR